MSVSSGSPVMCSSAESSSSAMRRRSASESCNNSGCSAPPTKTRISTAVVRRAAGKFLAGETGGDDPAAFDLRHDEAEAVEWVADLAAREAEADDGAAGVGDGGQLGGEFWIAGVEQFGGGVGGDGEDEGVEDCGSRLGLRIGERGCDRSEVEFQSSVRV